MLLPLSVRSALEPWVSQMAFFVALSARIKSKPEKCRDYFQTPSLERLAAGGRDGVEELGS